MDGSRLGILTLLQNQPDSTAGQLARHLGLAQGGVRRHLDILQRDGLVIYRVVKRKTGRPAFVYSLTEAGQESLPKGYQTLLSRFLHTLPKLNSEDLRSPTTDGTVASLFSQMARDVADANKNRFAGKPLPGRLAALLDILKEERFNPDVEYTPEGILVRLHNCPYRSVAMENPSVCAFDAELIATVLDSPVVRQECINRCDRRCVYFVSPVKKSDSQDQKDLVGAI